MIWSMKTLEAKDSDERNLREAFLYYYAELNLVGTEFCSFRNEERTILIVSILLLTNSSLNYKILVAKR